MNIWNTIVKDSSGHLSTNAQTRFDEPSSTNDLQLGVTLNEALKRSVDYGTLLPVWETLKLLENEVDRSDVIDMIYKKMVETIPLEKRDDLLDKLEDVILVSKSEGKMPPRLAKKILYHWQRGSIKEDLGLAAFLEATVLLEPDKTMEILGKELQLLDTVKKVKEFLLKGEK